MDGEIRKHFRLYTSNRLEVLLDALAEILRTPAASPFDPEIIVVQSKGMERWIAMELSRRHGVAAHYRFPFPNSFVYDQVFRSMMTDLPETSPFDREVMAWKIMRLLPSLLDRPEFEPLRNYLKKDGDRLRRYQLAVRIADLFDQYLVFRPEMIFAWEERKREDGWQPILWRQLTAETDLPHRAALGRILFDRLQNDPAIAVPLPERISVFGITTLPSFHLQMLDEISKHRPVHLFLLNPCADYWGDILSNRERRRALRRGREKGLSEAALYLGEENGLLTSMGMQGRDFFDMITDLYTDEFDDFQDPGEKTLLSCIQSDILFRRNRPSEQADTKVVEPEDGSVRIHVCHSPMREIEVLHDQLLALFDADPALAPRDILVMTPDIETYGPYIQAVFDRPADDPHRIPFSIADRAMRTESRVIDIFLKVLDMAGGRFGAAQVLSVLENPSVFQRFDLSETDLDRIGNWVRDTRIRWGVDAESRAGLGLPDTPENTWRAGLDRLLLGYAMAGGSERTFHGIPPFDAVEGGETDILGHFLEFTDRLFHQVNTLIRPASLSDWSERLAGLLKALFHADEETEAELQFLRDALAELRKTGEQGEFSEPVDIRVIKSHLSQRLQEDPFGFGFITGGITFCAMLPMRSIPFRVICLVGLNSEDYPRRSKPLGFDLMARHPKPGDRSRRNDDRYLFLESILSAREKLYISYVGRSIQDNAAIPPSVVVSELIDVIQRGFRWKDGDLLQDQLITEHRLQGFSPAYFMHGEAFRLFSYSIENCRAARRLVTPRESPKPFITGLLSEPESEWKTIGLETLISFFSNPAKFLLNRRLNLFLETEDIRIEEQEAFHIEGLDQYFLEDVLVKEALTGRDPAELYPLKRASGELPHGAVGESLFLKSCREAGGFAEKIQFYMADAPKEPLDIDLFPDGFRLTGRIPDIYPAHMVRYRFAVLKPKDHLRAWLLHLAMNAAAVEGYPRTTLIAGKDKTYEYGPVENSEEILLNLLTIYWKGLRQPLRFFPLSAWAYAESVVTAEKPADIALGKARGKWENSYYSSGEETDGYFHRCFRHLDSPLDSEFEALALAVFRPLLNHAAAV